ncbi:peptidase S8 and S53 subtilisin kexin sedolisin [Gemmatirosa kalamazoonensis]|uniref:Peptidase S8 and S53 subtilisin kexin sedolisin n=1 Tax=Gemmatirosa kalamazoonensis TaxID=861299 RepID=W0RBW9_9BACT|nr:S8 family serine peptidase [Gemmatirosa kalamazoonensis]AHG87810.1 peptidase S8 and S53 subtilisin kexin sedolisin [Gemmatirosa kalamazoonensis]
MSMPRSAVPRRLAAPLALAVALAFGACTSGRAAPAPAPTPTPTTGAPNTTTPPATASTPVPAVTADEPPQDWHLLDLAADGYAGISLRKAERELLAGRQPQRAVLVAVIDGGVDTSHADLRANLWTNPRETATNGSSGAADGDGDGLAGDVHGWNFIGGRDGRDVDHDTYEVTRLQVRCQARAMGGDSLTSVCPRVATEYEEARENALREQQQVVSIANALDAAMVELRAAIHDSVTTARVRALSSSNARVQQARSLYLQLAAGGITPQAIAEARKDVESRVKYGLNLNYDPRPIVGDDPANLGQRTYGNSDVMGPDAMHGTHVSGIIAGVRGNGVGLDGIAPVGTRVMMVRAVPDGDERDKDIANAIRYAVDHGAQIINMSFGKGWSPQKSAVDDAVKYADSKGVLLVHAAGNDGEDIATKPSFPTPFYVTGGHAQNWIEVGASSWKGGEKLAAEFSNWNGERVDLFAPGQDIYSTVPGGYERLSGTSMASPVVAGAAALLMSYFPELTAADVKRVLVASAARHATQRVVRPGSEDTRVPFGSLSTSGGIVNVYEAVKMVLEKKM